MITWATMKLNKYYNVHTFGWSKPILDEALYTSTWSLSSVGGSSNINSKSSSHLGSLFFFIICQNNKDYNGCQKITKSKKRKIHPWNTTKQFHSSPRNVIIRAQLYTEYFFKDSWSPYPSCLLFFWLWTLNDLLSFPLDYPTWL